MDFSFTSDQQDLRRMLRDIAEDHCSPERVRAAIDSDAGYDAELWRLVCDELGLVAIAVPEADGGAGGSFVDAAIVLEESGRGLWPVPLLPSFVAASIYYLIIGSLLGIVQYFLERRFGRGFGTPTARDQRVQATVVAETGGGVR